MRLNSILRKFILGSAIVTSVILGGCNDKKREFSLSEPSVLEKTLSGSDKGIEDLSIIENSLYDINYISGNSSSVTKGRATRLGNNLFLTAYHVVDKEAESLRLIPQHRRGYVLDYRTNFEVVAIDKTEDIALLKTEVDHSTEERNLTIDPIPIFPDEQVSTFIRLVGRPSKKEYSFEYGGRDFFDESKQITDLGSLHLPAQSLLFEKRGKSLANNGEGLRKSPYERFCSVSCYNGESGQPIFRRSSEGTYSLIGIVTGAKGIVNSIDTPNHPLGYEAMQQTGTYYTSSEAITKLLRNRLELKK